MQQFISIVLTHLKHLKSQANAFCYCFSVIKQYTLYYVMKLVPILENRIFFEILQLFEIWSYQSLVIFFLVFLWFSSKMNQMVFFLHSEQFSFR